MQTAIQVPGGIQTYDPNGLGSMRLYVLYSTQQQELKISVIFQTTNGYLLEKFISVVPPQLSRLFETVLTLIYMLFPVCMF
jgi:hypothetical protein